MVLTFLNFLILKIDDPIANRFSFSSGLTTGGYDVGVFIENLKNFTVYCKFGSIDCSKPCKTINSSFISCFVTAYPTGSFEFKFGYNQIHYINSNLTFTFVPCDAGYTSDNYSSNCYPCPIGSFKLTKGLYDCQLCPKNTYSNENGSISCKECPKKKVSKKGSNSISDCVCDIGYYKNPINSNECFTCPEGGICEKENLTIPIAKPGYWYSNEDINSFYLCTPKESCGGGKEKNCTYQYNGLRCGYCSIGFYKSKNKCYQCGDVYSTILKLLILIFGLLIFGIFLLITSTYYPSLLTSLSITISFWQVLSIISKYDIQWPWTIDTTLTAASTSNFNFDFLATACLFRGVPYIAIWILKMLLPPALILVFIFIYLLGEFRSLFAGTIGFRIINYFGIKYKRPPDYPIESTKKEEIKIWIIRQFIWLYNLFIWIPKHKSTRRDFKILFNRILNTLSAYISFLYIFMMTTASEIFVCTSQKNGSFTLNESADILCFQNEWWILFPLSVLWYLFFGIGILLYFGFMVIQRNKLKNDELFQLRFRFVLLRFKNKYFYWKIIET